MTDPHSLSPIHSQTRYASYASLGSNTDDPDDNELRHLTKGGRSAGSSHGRSLGSQSSRHAQANRRLTLQWWIESTRRLRREGIFVYLTILTGVMVIINFIQAAFLDHVHSFMWITIVPLVIFVAALLALFIYAYLSRERLAKEWKEAEAPERIAWIGIILSITLTIILCEFVYMPLFALPAWHDVQWAATLDISDSINYPAAAIAWTGGANLAVFDEPTCSFQAADNGSVRCEASAIQSIDGGQYFVFNTTNQSEPIINASLDGANSEVVLAVNMTYNSSVGGPPEIYIGFFDPAITFDMQDYLYVCGNPPVYFCTLPEVTTWTYLSFHVDTYLLDDQVGALKQQRSSHTQHCSAEVLALSEYYYYTGRYDDLSGTGALFNSSCDVANENYDPRYPCKVIVQYAVSSSLVTTQKSSRGTSLVKILIDEGGILGGVAFFTWFFSIFT